MKYKYTTILVLLCQGLSPVEAKHHTDKEKKQLLQKEKGNLKDEVASPEEEGTKSKAWTSATSPRHLGSTRRRAEHTCPIGLGCTHVDNCIDASNAFGLNPDCGSLQCEFGVDATEGTCFFEAWVGAGECGSTNFLECNNDALCIKGPTHLIYEGTCTGWDNSECDYRWCPGEVNSNPPNATDPPQTPDPPLPTPDPTFPPHMGPCTSQTRCTQLSDCEDANNAIGLNPACGELECDAAEGICRFNAWVDEGDCSSSNYLECFTDHMLCNRPSGNDPTNFGQPLGKGPSERTYHGTCTGWGNNECVYEWCPGDIYVPTPTQPPTPPPDPTPRPTLPPEPIPDPEVCQQRTITLDGNLDDWRLVERLYPGPWETDEYLPNFAVFGTYDCSAEPPTYYFALKADDRIGLDTTIYIDMDLDGPPPNGNAIETSEYYVDFVVDSQSDTVPHLNDNYHQPIKQVTDRAYNADNTTVEFAVSAADIGHSFSNPITDLFLLVKINGRAIPQYFDLKPLKLKARNSYLPARTTTKKRIALVFSYETSDNYFVPYAYQQLYASLQHQALNAGIPYDLVKIDALKYLSNIIKYDALVFPYNANVRTDDRELITDNLIYAVYHYHIGISLSGDFFTNDENGVVFGDPIQAYQVMKEVLGLKAVSYSGPADHTVLVSDSTHPMFSCYDDNEVLFEYPGGWNEEYGPALSSSTAVVVVAKTSNNENAILALETNGGARHVHFGSPSLMGDGNLLWKALRWIVFGGSNHLVGLQLSRQQSLFVSRNDMDQSRFLDEFLDVEGRLYSDFVLPWKRDYNFVSSYFINIGNNAANGEYTNWGVSEPLYQLYIQQGNEIASHSWTHPYHINDLTDAELRFEFDDTQKEIKSRLGLDRLTGTAQPGNPENLAVVTFLDPYLPYFSGTWTGVGSGYPSAFGYLTPDSMMAFYAPNMQSDFSLVEWRGLTPQQATEKWAEEYRDIGNHASCPIMCWHWHDYGPTSNPAIHPYTPAMFEDTIKMAYDRDAEFVTMLELLDRMNHFAGTEIDVNEISGGVSVNVTSANAGKFAIDLGCDGTQVIEGVEAMVNGDTEFKPWYANNDNKVFVPAEGGTFNIIMGSSPNNALTRIAALPMRSILKHVSGDGNMLGFTFFGEGKVRVELNADTASVLEPQGMDSNDWSKTGTLLEMEFTVNAEHTVTIDLNRRLRGTAD